MPLHEAWRLGGVVASTRTEPPVVIWSAVLAFTMALTAAFPPTADARPIENPHRTVTLELEGLPPIEFVRIPPGFFMMGTSSDDVEARGGPWYEPPFPVEMTRGVWLAKTEVTRELWYRVMGAEAEVDQARRPIAEIDYGQVHDFLEQLQIRVDAAHEGLVVRLPTELEWERAARAGSDRSVVDDIVALGWTRADGFGHPHPVATKSPNAWGLYDLFGNVNEFCEGFMNDYPGRFAVDWKGAEDDGRHPIRGGSYTGRVRHANPSDRGRIDADHATPWIGFRLAADGLEALIARDPIPLDVAIIGERVRVYRPETPVGNPTTIALLGDDETWLLDAGIPASAKAIARDLEAVGAAAVTKVITTHAHRDHVDGLAIWAERGAETLATAEQARDMAASPILSSSIQKGVDPRPLDPVEDDVRLTLRVDGSSIDVHVMRPASRGGHTDGDLVIHVPAFDLVYVGDLYFYDRLPIIGVDQGGTIDRALSDHRWIVERFPAGSIVVPGHNRFFPDPIALPSIEEFVRWSERIHTSVELIDAARAAGKGVEALVEKGLPPELVGLVARPRYVPAERWIRAVADR